MKDLDLATLLAVFHEMLGWALWALIAASALATVAFLFVVVRDRGVLAARMVRAELIGVLGGIGAVFAMFAVTSSDFADLGGPIDWLLVVAIFAAGLVGTAIGAYALMGLLTGRPEPAVVAPRAKPVQA